MKKISLILLISLSAMISNLALADSNVEALLDIQPEYPQSALRRDLSGHVVVRFDIDSNGKAHNISIVEASPARIFNSAVRVALKRSIFSTSNDSSASFERTYNFNLTANESDLANRFNFMEEAPQLAAN
tara:strand:+ start:392 stop:781 length:390 start_codon:yes stop_codon:yes gene_type:complete